MGHLKLTAVLALFLSSLGAGTTVRAETILLQCEFPGQKASEWISPNIVFAYQQGAKEAIVADNVILNFLEKPAEAKLKTTSSRLKVSWAVIGASDSWGNPIRRFDYFLELDTRTNTAHVRGRPIGYAGNLRARGTCGPAKNRKQLERLLRRG